MRRSKRVLLNAVPCTEPLNWVWSFQFGFFRMVHHEFINHTDANPGVVIRQAPIPPWGQPRGNKWFLQSTPIQMPPQRGGLCERLTQDVPSTRLQGGSDPGSVSLKSSKLKNILLLKPKFYRLNPRSSSPNRKPEPRVKPFRTVLVPGG